MLYIISFCDFPMCLLPWLLSGLLGGIIGYLLGNRWKSKYQEMESKYNSLRSKMSGLENDLEACVSRRSGLEAELKSSKGTINELKTNFKQSQSELKLAQDEASKATLAMTKLKSDDGTKEALKSAQVEVEKLKNDHSKVQADLQRVHDELAKSKSDLSKEKEESNRLSKALKSAEDKIEAVKAEAKSSAETKVSGTDLGAAVAGFAAGKASSSDSADSTDSSKATDSRFAGLKSDNLQIIEGIGPKMDEVLKDAGISSWAVLGSKSSDDVRGILDTHGDKYKIINPDSWSEQAQLAADGKWDELILLQKQLDGGVDSNINLTDSKLEKMIGKSDKAGFGKFKMDDLKIVEGIGPKIAELLNNAGITTWAGLADTPVEKIQEVLEAAGSRFALANPGSWPRQAGLAANGKWDELARLQDELDGGV